MGNHLPPGTYYVCSPPPGYEWRLEFPKPSEVRESGTIEIKETTGHFIKPQPKVIPVIEPSPAGFQSIVAEGRWLSNPEHLVEHFITLFFDTQGNVCGKYEKSDGLERRCTVDIDRVIREARKHRAAGLVLFHNHCRRDEFSESLGRHWAGGIEPSRADIELTRDFRQALREEGLAFIDHIVCGPRSIAYSFDRAEQPMMTEYDMRVARMDARGY